MARLETSRRKRLSPPSGCEGHLSRFEAARILGFPSEYRVRQLEKEGRLRAVRGVMGSAWYARADVLALRTGLDAEVARPTGTARGWSDAALMALLRQGDRGIVDLIIEAGISMARAQKVYRFWQTHDRAANASRVNAVAGRTPAVNASAEASGQAVSPAVDAPEERRSPERRTRTTLIERLRDPDPEIRAAAFAALKARESASAASRPADSLP